MTLKDHPDQTLHQKILQHLETLNIPLRTEQLDEILAAAAQSKCSSLQLLERVLAVPANRRRERSIESRLKTAKFRDPATFESFDWEFNRQTIDRADFEELATGDFIRRRDNLAFVGESGLGKSHLIQSVGRRCCELGYRVRYTTAPSCWRISPQPPATRLWPARCAIPPLRSADH